MIEYFHRCAGSIDGIEDKTFELLEKMYSDFSTRFDRVESDITAIKNDVRSLKDDVIRIENDIGKKTDAAAVLASGIVIMGSVFKIYPPKNIILLSYLYF